MGCTHYGFKSLWVAIIMGVKTLCIKTSKFLGKIWVQFDNKILMKCTDVTNTSVSALLER